MTHGEVITRTDTGWSVALLSGLVAFLTLASFRSSGYLYVEIMNEFSVDRGSASWPVSVLGTLIDIGGVLSSPLTRYFSVSTVLLIGTLITTLGMTLSAFAPGILWLTITMGIIHGIGSGTIMTMLQVQLSANYKRYRGMAHGIMYAGATLSSFVVPPLLPLLLRHYDFRSTLLLFGGILLHTFPISLFLDIQQKNNQLLCLPTYYILVISWLVRCYNFDIFVATIVDFATDKGASKPDAVCLLSYMAVPDLLGRLFLPLLADQEYLRRSTLVACNFFFMGMAILILPDVNSYVSLLTATLAISCFLGTAVAMHGVVMADTVGLKRLPVSYGFTGALCGPLLFAKPFFIGYFRDYHGKYDAMYRVLAGLLLLVSLMWFVAVYLEKPAPGSHEDQRKPHPVNIKEV
ncbi:monocarboxylate transporter 12 [Ixodes scapularis]|uniref:monocarboxylate transporter 12 n=1 Tax=Ixodes scapularis TaxID=6945 RepID=UPI001A9D4C86|nr:monocarboxylate transporter 12 [Ixodes scapularis]